jgi:hypothetical protein
MKNSFDLKKALAGHSVFTRDGRKVTNIRVVNQDAPKSVREVHNEKYIQGIEGTIHNLSGPSVYPFYHDGGSHKYGGSTLSDLIMMSHNT